MRKFDRFVMDELSVGELYNILSDSKYVLRLCVYSGDFETRYVIPKFGSYDEYIAYLSSGDVQKVDHGMDSGSFNIYNCDYIDCYTTLYK
jgi:hypothetical protein